MESADGTKSAAALPSPPEDEALPLEFNGERFSNQLFSPQGHIEETLIRAIQAAKASIEIAMFSFYSQAIADALLDMKNNHPEIRIQIIMDYSQSKMAKLDEWFAYHGFDVRLLSGPDGDAGDPMFQKMHNKLMILDGKLLETGSFNYSPNAENNSFENANFITDPTDLAGYVAYFQRLWQLGWKPAPPKKKQPQPLLTLAPVKFMTDLAVGDLAGWGLRPD
jgi:phosphatidylserine/phosphatidylglycerophosphate/cardiolipin synthase-like enzyme